MAFSYRVTLQVRHPDADPEKIVAAIGRAARRYWKVGEARTTLTGEPLSGTYQESYCVFDHGGSEDGQLASFLRRTLVDLENAAEFINDLRRTGGKVNYYVSWFPGDHGELFDVDLIADMARLGIDLGIEPVC
ncbi:hypothetical protein QE385_003225 [Sphingomonas sp. SORGH_AS 950]|uniref:hypothetical protein n=1 Tax=Sphingomonas sp. SORGH_AS_0950 TaxID=3041792 RepID=UPI0027866CAB|nr:hypothetical protein [Sphingomonas sp. SORGH_AS_0950]MDQ1158898.1 hypothetical protein [Sphingomonas sp. SORGH_AS_0950]